MTEPVPSVLRSARDFSAWRKLRPQVGTLGKWVPWWGMLSVQRYMWGVLVLVIGTRVWGLWWPSVAKLGIPYNILVGALIWVGPCVAAVLFIGYLEARNISPLHFAFGHMRAARMSLRALGEHGRLRPVKCVVIRGSKASALVRDTGFWHDEEAGLVAA